MTVQLLMAAKLLVLARLLSPNDFGIMGIALLIVSLFETFSVTGIDAALVSKREEIESYLDTAWTVAVLRGFCLALIAYASAPLVAYFFQTPDVAPVLRAIALACLVRGLVNSATVYFQREMDFNKTFILGVAEAVSDALVSICLAIILGSVWALVIGYLAGTGARAITSYALHPRRPALRFDLTRVRELSGFGRWFWGSNVLTYLGANLDGVVIGRLLGPASLGLYQVSNRISLYLTREVMEMISQVTFPMYARLAGENERLRGSFLLATRIGFSVTFPLVLATTLFAEPLVRLALGAKWLAAAPVLQLLVISSLLRGLGGLGGWLFYGVGTPKSSFVVTALRVIILAVLLIPLSHGYGLPGAALAVLFANAGMLLSAQFLVKRMIAISWFDYLWNILPSFLLSVATIGLPYFFLQIEWEPHILQWRLLWILPISAIIYIACLMYLEKSVIGQLKKAFVPSK